jgi:hypothetical protein
MLIAASDPIASQSTFVRAFVRTANGDCRRVLG